MKAMINRKYGNPDILRLEEIPIPIPGPGQVVIQLHYTSLNKRDYFLLLGKPFLVRLMTGALFSPKEKILGTDVAGVITKVGQGVENFKPGDRVFGDLSANNAGGFAEYCVTAADALVKIPEAMDFKQAAALPMGGVTAYQGLVKAGGLKAGQKVLINGASGGVGLYAVQIALALGADVTATCSPAKMELLHSLGVEKVINYQEQDCTQLEEQFHLILAANGYHPIKNYMKILLPGGTYVCSGGDFRQIFQTMLRGKSVAKKYGRNVSSLYAVPDADDLTIITGLFTSGKIKGIIDDEYPLERLPQALKRLGEGHVRGKLLISFSSNSNDNG